MPRTSTDPLKAFASLRASLVNERKLVADRIAAITAALDGSTALPAMRRAAPSPKRKPRRKKRVANAISLKDAVLQATSKTALTKPEILAAVEKLGYHFSAKNPTNSLNTLLYGMKPKFKNADGKFSPV